MADLDIPPPVTRWLAERAASFRAEDLPEAAVTIARHCILDWFAVTIPGAREPVVEILAEALAQEGGAPLATLVGRGRKTAPLQAALINGTASHALDFDDVNMAILGHPTVAVLPGLLALAEERGATQDAVITAFVAGYDVACRVGDFMSPGHYAHGFHCTSTVGSIGAAAACGHLLGLDPERMAMALGTASTQASGLKSMFGTMCKPLHAGMAARNGLLAARLAAGGFTSRPDALECAQGFARTQSVDFSPAEAMQDAPIDFHIRNNLFKYHASCYLTHGAIEAARKLRVQGDLSSNAISAITLRVAPVTDRVCNLSAPATGLEAKFSLRLTLAMGLTGRDTSAIATYTDDVTREPELVRLRDLVHIEFVEGQPEAWAEVTVSNAAGETFVAIHDAGEADPDLTRQGDKLCAKFRALVVPVLGDRAASLETALTGFGGSRDLSEIAALAGAMP